MGESSALSPKVKMYSEMVRARKMEEAILELFKRGGIPGSTHLGIGQEAVAVGVVSNLRKDDYVVGTYRGHILALAKGLSMKEIFSEILGRDAGSNRGYGGSMHLTKKELGLMGNFSIVGAGIPFAVGLGSASRLRGEERITACFFGDGATNIGYFHESLNMAAIYKCPVLFVIENNLYSEYTPIREIAGVSDLSERGKAYGIYSVKGDGNDVDEVYSISRNAVKRIRSKEGPVLIEFKTYRKSGHSRLDDGTSYRPQSERELWFSRDPISTYRSRLLREGLLTPQRDQDLANSADAEVHESIQFASAARYPDHSDMRGQLFCERNDVEETKPTSEPVNQTFRAAIRTALIQGMERDKDIVLLGEDVAKAGGVFKVTDGLLDMFGAKRVWDTPIAENSMAGMAMGLAVAGFRPVLEIMFSDFLLMAMDAIGNEIAKMRWTSGGQFCVPLVIRTACGAGLGWASHHSQVLDSLFLPVPGIKVVTPSNSHDAKGLLSAALKERNPVIFYEHKSLYPISSPTYSDYYTIPLGKAKVIREGDDVTVVSSMAMVLQVLKAAEILGNNGVSAEVIDLRCLVPLDVGTILSSVTKTGTLVTVEESPMSGGWGNSVVSSICEKGLYYLKRPVKRIGVEDLPIPFSPALESAVLPNAEAIAWAITNLLSA